MSRVSRAGGVDGGPGPKITIPFVEKSLAEQARKNGGTVDYNRKRKGGALLTPSSQSKRASPPAKKARTSGPASRTGGREIVSDTDPLSTSRRKPNKEASVSSFGRQRTPKRSYAYDEDIDIDPLDTAALAQNDVGSSPSPKSKRKSGPASASKGSAKNDKKGKKGGGGAQQGYYYVGDEGEAIQAPDPEPEEDDQEEIFPSIGPYQCEICQEITDTKQEFVNHIKRFHRNVVDEEVLRSLEQDLKKSKKAAAAKAVGKTASGKEGKPGKAGPAARKKPAAPAPTAKKSRPSPAARKPATPKSKPKSRAAPKSRARPAPKARASPAAAAAESNNLSTAAEVAPAYVSNGDADGMKTTQKVNGGKCYICKRIEPELCPILRSMFFLHIYFFNYCY